jgi:hypothetical protein
MEASTAALSVKSFCAEYSIGRNRAYDEINSGRLATRLCGRRRLIRKVDADAWLENLPKGVPDEQPRGE